MIRFLRRNAITNINLLLVPFFLLLIIFTADLKKKQYMTHALNIVWNPSEGIDLGFFMVRYYSLMFVIAFGLGWYIMKKIFEREGESIEKLDSLFIWTVLATLLGARLGHVFFYDWEYYRNHLIEILLPIRENANESLFNIIQGWEFTGFQGLASHGAAISIIIAMYYFSKNVLRRPQLWILDRVVVPVASGAIFVRLGNFFNSEIIGHETTSAFGIKFIRDHFSPMDAVNATGIPNPQAAYAAIAHDPKFSALLEQVPAIFLYLLPYTSCIGKQKKENIVATYLECS